MRGRRLLPIALSLLILTGAASAEFSTAFSALRQAYQSGQAYALRLNASVQAWPDVAPETLAALQGWLDTAQLSLSLQKQQGRETALARLSGNGQTVFTLMNRIGGDQADMTLEVPGSLAATRYVGTEALPPWQYLLGTPRLPDVDKATSTLDEIQALSLARLLPFEKAVRSGVSIRNAGRAASQLVYTLNASEAQALWEEAGPKLLPLLGRLADDLAFSSEDFMMALSSLAFTRALTLKRYLNDNGSGLGFQITGTIQLKGQARGVTVFFGQSDRGLYLSLKSPATRGGDTLEVRVSLAYAAGRVQGDWRYKSILTGKKLEASGKVDLKNSPEGQGERISGSLTARLRFPDRTADLLLTPDLLLDGSGASGTIKYTEQAGKTVLRDLALSLDLSPVGEIRGPEALAEVRLEQAGAEQIALSAAQVRPALMPALKGFLFSLPLPVRLLVLHDFGRVRRTQGETVPLTEDGQNNQFTVTDTDKQP